MTTPIKSVPRNLPAPTTATAVLSRLLQTAASQIGYREGRDADGDWNNDNAYGKWYGSNGVSWCAQFVSWAAATAGIPTSVIPKHQYTPTGWNWFVAHDRDVTSPRAGDIFYVYGPVQGEKNPRVHHVGIVEKVLSGGRIQTIEGNTNTTGSSQGNGVYRLTRTVSTKLRFARPNYAAAVTITKLPTGGTAKPPTLEDDMPDINEVRTVVADELNKQDAQLWGTKGGTGTKFIADTRAGLAALTTQVAGLTAAVQTLAQNNGYDPEAVIAAVKEATEKAAGEALANLKITLAVEDDAKPATQEN